MTNVLINGYGTAFFSKIKNEQRSKDLIFIWKNNIFIPRKKLLNQEYKNWKLNALKSTASKKNYQVWKSTIYQFEKLKLKYEKQLKTQLIKKGYLQSIIEGDKIIEKSFLKNNASSSFQKIIDKTKVLVEDRYHKEVKNKLLKIAFNFKVFSGIINDFKQEINLLHNKVLKLKNCFNNSQKNFFTTEQKIKRSFLKQKAKFIFQNFQNKNNYNNYILNKQIAYFQFKYDFYNKHKNFSYDFQYEALNANLSKKYFTTKLKEKLNYSTQYNQLIASSKANGKDYFKKYTFELKKLKKAYKSEWKVLKINLKSQSASRKSIKLEFQKLRSHFLISKRNLRLKIDQNFQFKNKLSIFKTGYRHQKKRIFKMYLTEKSDLLKSIPTEISNQKYWFLNIIGSILPGSSAFIKKQYFKGFMLALATLVSGLIFAWSFGAFPAWYGNGIVGLKSLGWDTSTQNVSDAIIGLTNNQPNDARFFLVTGVISICLLVLSIGFFIIQGLNNINVNNLSKLGVRHTKFLQQKAILKGQGLPFLISAPAFIFIIFIVIIPIIATLLISFTNMGQNDVYDSKLSTWRRADGVSWPIKWIGFKQYIYIFDVIGPEFGKVLLWTLIWTFSSASLAIILGTFLAIIVNQSRIKGKNFFRLIYLLPWSVPAFITIMFFSIMFQPFGIFNKAIGNKIFAPNRQWLYDGSNTKLLMIMLQGWLGFSYIFLLITSLLQAIPRSLYEAARVDGASSFKQLKGITIPIIVARIAPLLIGQFTFAFNNFGLIYLLNQGGIAQPGKTAGQFDIFISWVYKLINSSSNTKPGAAAAISLVISIFTVTPSAFLFLKSKSFKGGNF